MLLCFLNIPLAGNELAPKAIKVMLWGQLAAPAVRGTTFDAAACRRNPGSVFGWVSAWPRVIGANLTPLQVSRKLTKRTEERLSLCALHALIAELWPVFWLRNHPPCRTRIGACPEKGQRSDVLWELFALFAPAVQGSTFGTTFDAAACHRNVGSVLGWVSDSGEWKPLEPPAGVPKAAKAQANTLAIDRAE